MEILDILIFFNRKVKNNLKFCRFYFLIEMIEKELNYGSFLQLEKFENKCKYCRFLYFSNENVGNTWKYSPSV